MPCLDRGEAAGRTLLRFPAAWPGRAGYRGSRLARWERAKGSLGVWNEGKCSVSKTLLTTRETEQCCQMPKWGNVQVIGLVFILTLLFLTSGFLRGFGGRGTAGIDGFSENEKMRGPPVPFSAM